MYIFINFPVITPFLSTTKSTVFSFSVNLSAEETPVVKQFAFVIEEKTGLK